MTDPFLLLGIDDDDPDPQSLLKAMNSALRNGVPLQEARRARDVLSDPDQRAAMALLSVSRTPSWKRLDEAPSSRTKPPEAVLLDDLVAAVVAEMDRLLRSPAVLPLVTPRRDIRHYLPVTLEELDP